MVGARAPGTEQISQQFLSFLTHKKKKGWGVPFWPGGRGGRPRALIWSLPTKAGLVDGGFREAGQGLGGGVQGLRSGGVGGRDTKRMDFATCVVNAVGWGGGFFSGRRGKGSGGGCKWLRKEGCCPNKEEQVQGRGASVACFFRKDGGGGYPRSWPWTGGGVNQGP